MIKQQKGSSLLEVLIAIVVISVGLLGLAGLQTSSIKSNHSSYLRSQATLLAYDLSDRMRASRAAALSGNYNTKSNHSDKEDWDELLFELMGSDVASTVTRAGDEFTITITWNDARGSIQNPSDIDPDQQQSFSYILEL